MRSATITCSIPIRQRDFYAMKALFDPLVIKKVNLAGPAEMMAHGKALEAFEKKRAALEAPVERADRAV